MLDAPRVEFNENESEITVRFGFSSPIASASFTSKAQDRLGVSNTRRGMDGRRRSEAFVSTYEANGAYVERIAPKESVLGEIGHLSRLQREALFYVAAMTNEGFIPESVAHTLLTEIAHGEIDYPSSLLEKLKHSLSNNVPREMT